MDSSDREALLARALDWIAGLPLLGEPELAGLLGIHELDARSIRHELVSRGRIESIVPGTAGLEQRRLSFLRAGTVSALDELSGWLPVRRTDVLDRIARLEITAAVNRFLATLAAAVRDRNGIELMAVGSLPVSTRPGERWWFPGAEAFGCLRAGRLSAPFFLAWDRAGAPDAHRRQRIANWWLARDAVAAAWEGEGIPPLLVVCADDRALRTWEEALLRRADRDGRAAFDLFLTTAEEAAEQGPGAAIWRAPGRRRSAPLVEQLYWGELEPRYAQRLPVEILDTTPERMAEPLRAWAARVVVQPDRVSKREWLAAFALATDEDEKQLLRWIARLPLLSIPELAALTDRPEVVVARRMEWLLRCAAVRADGRIDGTDGAALRYALTRRGLESLAERDGVPSRRYEKHAGVAAPPAHPERPNAVIIRHREHTLGVNRFAARLAADARAAGWRLAWRNEAESAHRFEHDGGRWWIRPDGSGELVRGAESRPFLFEYDRGTLDGGDYRGKFQGYRRYYASRQWKEDFDSEPVLLFVCIDDRTEQRVAAAARRETSALPLFFTTAWRIELAASGARPPFHVVPSAPALATVEDR